MSVKEGLMNKTITIQVDIPHDHTVCIPLPEDVPVGLAELMVVVKPIHFSEESAAGTAADLVHSPLFGLWSDRDDIADGLAYARQLRVRAERRHHG